MDDLVADDLGCKATSLLIVRLGSKPQPSVYKKTLVKFNLTHQQTRTLIQVFKKMTVFFFLDSFFFPRFNIGRHFVNPQKMRNHLAYFV